MRLTPLDIKKQDFKRVMRGVDPEEVQAFLQMVADQWQDLADDQSKLEHKITELETKLQHYKEVEEALQEAVKTARESSRQTLEAAKTKAQSIIDNAAESAERLQRKATEDQYELRRDVDLLYARRREAITRLRNLLRSELELLEEFDQQYPIPTVPVPADEFKSDLDTGVVPEEVAGNDPRMEAEAEPIDLVIPAERVTRDHAQEESEAVRDIEELEAVASPDQHQGLDESHHSEDTLVFTEEDSADEPKHPGAYPSEGRDAPRQTGAGHATSSGDSFRDSTEIDKIRKILDDLS